MLKQILLRLVLVAFGVFLALVVIEGLLRIVPAQPSPGSGALRTHHRSTLDSPDFRHRQYSWWRAARGAEQPFRILVVGDSFTWGGNVLEEDAYPDRMAVRLAKWHGEGRFEVINFSRPGWNTGRELGATRAFMPRIDPDMLIVGYVLNDAEPMRRKVLERLRGPSHAPRTPESAFSRLLYARSRAYRLLFDKLENIRRRRALVRYYHSLYRYEPGWSYTRESLAGFKALADERDIPFLLVLFPIFDSQLDWRYKYEGLHELMQETAERLDIDLLDLRSTYRDVDARRLASVPFTDGHPSELAHRIAAQAILERLVERGIIPPHPSRRR